MLETVNIFKSRPILSGSLSLLVFLTCCYHFLIRVGLDSSVLIGLIAIIVFLTLTNELKIFLSDSFQDPKKIFYPSVFYSLVLPESFLILKILERSAYLLSYFFRFISYLKTKTLT